MSDFNSSLPVRTENNGDVAVKVVDGTLTSQALGVDAAGKVTVKLDDAAGNGLTSQVSGSQRPLDVGINVAGVQVDPRTIGQYNSTLPTLTTGQYAPAAVDVNGRLIAVPETDVFPANQNITAQDLASTSTAQFNQTWISGTATAGSTASYPLSSNETGLVEITGTWTGTLVSEVSVDGGTNWIAHAIHLLGSPIFTTSFTGNVMGSINLAAKTQFRIRSTGAMTGTATVKLNLSVNSSSVYVANALKLADGSSATSTVTATIKAASTAALTTDTSLVVSLSPNSPLPAGTALLGKVEITDGTNVAGVAPASTAATTTQPAQVVALSPNSPLPAGTNLLGSVNQGTSPWITKDNADGPVTPGTVAGSSQLIGAQFNTSLPTLTNGQQSALQADSSGRLLVGSIAGALPAGTNLLGSINLDSAGTPITNTGGALNVNISSGSIDVGVADKTAFTYGTTVFEPIGGVFQDTSPTLTAGQSGASRLTANRGLHVNLRDSSGNEKLGSSLSAASIPVVVASDQAAFPIKVEDGSGNSIGSTSGALNVAVTQSIAAGTNIIGKIEITDGTSTVGVTPASTAATSTQPAEVVALSPNSPLPAGTNALGSVLANIQVANAAVSNTNPVPVTLSTTSPGTAIQDYHTSAALAAGSSATFTYTVVAAHTFNLERIWSSASGKIKAVAQIGGTTFMVGFNSTANPNIDMTIISPPTIAAAGTVSVIITNDDKAAMDVYCTIEGNQN